MARFQNLKDIKTLELCYFYADCLPFHLIKTPSDFDRKSLFYLINCILDQLSLESNFNPQEFIEPVLLKSRLLLNIHVEIINKGIEKGFFSDDFVSKFIRNFTVIFNLRPNSLITQKTKMGLEVIVNTGKSDPSETSIDIFYPLEYSFEKNEYILRKCNKDLYNDIV